MSSITEDATTYTLWIVQTKVSRRIFNTATETEQDSKIAHPRSIHLARTKNRSQSGRRRVSPFFRHCDNRSLIILNFVVSLCSALAKLLAATTTTVVKNANIFRTKSFRVEFCASNSRKATLQPRVARRVTTVAREVVGNGFLMEHNDRQITSGTRWVGTSSSRQRTLETMPPRVVLRQRKRMMKRKINFPRRALQQTPNQEDAVLPLLRVGSTFRDEDGTMQLRFRAVCCSTSTDACCKKLFQSGFSLIRNRLTLRGAIEMFYGLIFLRWVILLKQETSLRTG